MSEAVKELPPVEYLRELLDYDPETGVLTWRERPLEMFKTERGCNAWNTRYAGKEAGCVDTKPSGYQSVLVRLNGKRWMGHRLAFALYYGRDPGLEIDHVNRVSTDNRICNLRAVDHSRNVQNRVTPYRNNTSGYLGVSWAKREQKWLAHIRINGKKKHLGYFDAPEAAHTAYLTAKAKHHSGAVVA